MVLNLVAWRVMHSVERWVVYWAENSAVSMVVYWVASMVEQKATRWADSKVALMAVHLD